MALRDAIKAQHDRAEEHPLSKLIMSGKVSKEVYADLLASQIVVFSHLENIAKEMGLLDTVQGIERTDAMRADLEELGCGLPHCESSVHAIHLNRLDRKGILAHMYVLHMGDLFGGQIMKKLLPGACRRYEFENRTELVHAMRSLLSDDLADEANIAFEYVLRLFNGIAEEHHILDS
jgi:heme oxygenase